MKNEKVESNYKNIAAHFDKPEFNTVEKPVENNITGEDNMSLQDYLKDNPEAKAEFDEALKSAKAEGLKNSDVNKDRARINSILESSGIEITKDVQNAIESDISDGDFAMEELKRQKEVRNKTDESVSFGNLVAKELPKDQDESSKSKIQSDEDFDKESKEMAKQMMGGN